MAPRPGFNFAPLCLSLMTAGVTAGVTAVTAVSETVDPLPDDTTLLSTHTHPCIKDVLIMT